MTEQLQLVKSPAPAISPDEVQRLLGALVDAGERQTAAELSVRMFGSVTEGLKRRVRAIAGAARPRVVSFPGSNGYQLWERCTVEEIQHGIEAMEAQGKDMIRDANVYRMAYNRRYRGKPAPDAEQGSLL